MDVFKDGTSLYACEKEGNFYLQDPVICTTFNNQNWILNNSVALSKQLNNYADTEVEFLPIQDCLNQYNNKTGNGAVPLIIPGLSSCIEKTSEVDEFDSHSV
jgi:hypothetical protein